MFNVYAGKRKRRTWSPGTVAVSIGAHVLLLAGAVSAGVADHKHEDTEEGPITWLETDPPPPPKVVEPTPPPPAPEPQRQAPVPGDFVSPRPPTVVPTVILPPNPHAPPLTADDVTGEGEEGDVRGTPPVNPAPPTGNTTPNGDGDGPFTPEMVEELPSLANRSEAERLFRRHYPPLLRETGITGRTTVLMIIDAEGKVEPGSVSVQETTHEAFREAAIKVAEKLRFRPAKLNKQPVPVLISVPIDWRLEN